ncbi:acetyltransferase [Halobacteriales archaeon QH_2_65_14]|jgi:phage tail-like protein|nr:MAG: acetyltransferase [Halobacteriales archaeon QH_2_65_14]
MPENKKGPYRKFNFEVELVDGPKVGGFDKISGLTMQMETVEYREGGVNDHVHKLPGQYSHENLILENGIADERVVFDWVEEVRNGEKPVEEARSNVEILIRSGYKEKERWGFEFFDAYPVQWDGPDLRARQKQGDVAIQTMELAHNGFTNLSGTPG